MCSIVDGSGYETLGVRRKRECAHGKGRALRPLEPLFLLWRPEGEPVGRRAGQQAGVLVLCVCVCVGSVFVRKGPQVSLGAALSLCVSHKCPGSPDPSSVEPTTSLHTC